MIQLMRRLLLLFLIVMGLSLLAGCSSKGKQDTTPSLMLQAPLRAFLLPFEGDEGLIQEDVDNIGLFLQELLESLPHVELVQNEAAKADLLRKINYQNPVTLRRMGETHLVEAVLRGKVHKFSYRKDRNHLNLNLGLTLLAINTFTGEKFFEVTRDFDKRYRVRNARNRDFSDYNKRFLKDAFDEFLLEFHRRVYALAEAQKERNGGVLPTKLVSVQKSSNSTGPELMHVLLWPIDASGQAVSTVQPIKEKPEVSRLSQRSHGQSGPVDPVQQRDQSPGRSKSASSKLKSEEAPSWRQRAKQLAESYKVAKDLNQLPAAKPANSKISQPSNPQVESQKEPNSSPEKPSNKMPVKFDLRMAGYQLVYPPSFSDSKKYQKFYYLLDDVTKTKASIEDLNSASKETAVLEVFSTADDKAVKRFMDDYFHGVTSNPKGKIPEVYERIYSGKYQVGFRVEDKAVVATTDRDFRERILEGLESLYVNNGGVSVARIIARSFQKGRKAADIIFEDVQTLYEEKAEEVDQSQEDARRRSKQSRVQNVQGNQKKLESAPENDVSDRPVNERITTKSRRQEAATKTPEIRKPVQIVSRPKAPALAVQKTLPANAVFFFDMARGYYQSGDFETALRYFQLAQKNGYEVAELQDYINKISEEMGKNPPQNLPVTTKPKDPASKLEYEEFDYARWRERANNVPENVNPADNSLRQDLGVVQPLKPASTDSNPPKIEPPEKPMEEFYKEMQKMESEIQRYMKGKSKLSTVASYSQRITLTEFLIQVIFLVASTLAIISIISSQKSS